MPTKSPQLVNISRPLSGFFGGKRMTFRTADIQHCVISHSFRAQVLRSHLLQCTVPIARHTFKLIVETFIQKGTYVDQPMPY